MDAKILFWDLEKAPGLYWGWDLYNPPFSQEEKSSITCFSYKWAHEDEVHTIRFSKMHHRLNFRDDSPLIKAMAKVLNEADVMVAHNGDKFDWKVFNAKVVEHNLPPVKKPMGIDTLKMARSQFKFDSNRLADLCKYLKIPLKMETSKNLFKSSMTSWVKYQELLDYNKQDVVALEALYNKLKVYCKPALNVGRLRGLDLACVNCGSENIIKEGYYFTQTGKVQRHKCKDCGSRANVETAGKKKLMRGII